MKNMVNSIKKQLVKELLDSISSSSNFVVLSYDKTTHQTFEALRNKLRKDGVQIKVLKNTFFEKALQFAAKENKNLGEIKNNYFPLKGSSAFMAFGEDWSIGLKGFAEFAKKEESLGIKFGILDGTVYSDTSLEAISKLPGKDQLISKVIGGLKSPSSRNVRSLQFPMLKLVNVLKEHAKQEA